MLKTLKKQVHGCLWLSASLSVLVFLMTASIETFSAGITRIEITSVESPTFNGKTFGDVGAYEKLRGKAFGEVDPNDLRNAVITDLQLAPRNARGMVEYSMDIYILKPVDVSKGNHKLFVEVNQRGSKVFGPFNLSGGGNNPTTAADAGEGFLMNQGYSLAWNGWDPSAPSGGDNLTITVPVARNPDGSSITGPAYEYIVFDNSTALTYRLSYPTASHDHSKATLTVRDHLNDAPKRADWEFVNDTTIRLLPAGTPFKQSAIYEFSYTAKDPVVAGIGFAATRDFVSFLRNAKADSFNRPNPLAGDIERAYAFAVSQPGRYMNDFVWLGFNEDKGQRKIFDGVENWIAAGTGVGLNYRFAQPSRTERTRQDHRYPEGIFPFAYTTLTDPFTSKTDGRLARCTPTDTCPKIMSVNSANEYWVKAGSLLHTNTQGNDLDDPDNVRFYLLSGVEHNRSGSPPKSRGICQQFRNTTDPNPALRALFIAMDQWVVDGTAPPHSRVPRTSDGTAVFIQPTENSVNGVGKVPQDLLDWPTIPGVTYTGVVTVRNLLNFGPRLDQGILSINPPIATGEIYPAFVSTVDDDGNEIAGVRLPPVAAPVATTTGWALRADAFGGADGCEGWGQFIPFATTEAQRQATGDPRPSLQERYRDHAGYVRAVTKAANKLAKHRLLLPSDVQRYISGAEASDVLK
ncbi:hypothetical protein G3N94_13905 [Burkholderia sp. Ac-20353]|nr:hypothetical protein [Burkholderia sp. Ac-20353]